MLSREYSDNFYKRWFDNVCFSSTIIASTSVYASNIHRWYDAVYASPV